MSNNLVHSLKDAQVLNKMFQDAEELANNGNDVEAEKRYLSVLNNDPGNVFCLFRLGEIYNRKKEPHKSYEYHMKAFESDKHLASKLTSQDHVSNGYVYEEKEETINEVCPLCGSTGKLHSCYNDVTNIDFIPGFNPVRMWMYCSKCDHIFARNYPSDLGNIISNSQGFFHMKPNVNLLPIVAETMKQIRRCASGNKLLDIGVGAGEFAAIAKEYRFDVSGIEIRKAYADQVSKNLDINIYNTDFMNHVPSDKYDVVSMGDVIEHIPDPVSALKKVNALLNNNGLLWISTPNFRSAYSYILKDLDPMWRVCEHLNYFSYNSLEKLMKSTGFEIMEYNSSAHYRGSMEVLAVKKGECFIANKPKSKRKRLNGISKLNLGCGKDIRAGWINLDIIGLEGVDVVADLDSCSNSPLPFEENSIDEVYAGHLIEYIKNPLSLMEELHRICRPEAKAVFQCHYGSSDSAMEDPSHIRQYFLNSFGYFSQPFYWKADYGYRGDWMTEKITLYIDKKYNGKNISEIMDDINRKRNIVRDMTVELKPVKPIREPKRELQNVPEVEILFI